MGAAAGSSGGQGATGAPSQSATGTVPSGMQSQLGGMFNRMQAPRPLSQPRQGTTMVPALDRFTTSSSGMSPQQYGWTQTEAGRTLGGQEQLNANINQNVQRLMGNPQAMVDMANQTQTSRADLERAMGSGDLYTYMNRPDYKQYGPSGQFYQPIYRSSYNQYQGPSQFYSPGYGPFGGGGYNMPMASNPFGYGGGGVDGGMPSLPARGFGFNVPSYMFAEGGEVDSEDDGIAKLLKR